MDLSDGQNGKTEGPAKPEESVSKEFHIEEYKSLRAEITLSYGRLATTLQYVLLVSGGVYGFLLGKDPTGINSAIAIKIGLTFPVVASVAGTMMCIQETRYMIAIGGYLALVEEKFARSSLGWEHYFATQVDGEQATEQATKHVDGEQAKGKPPQVRQKRRRGTLQTTILLWISLCLINVAVAVAGWSDHLFKVPAHAENSPLGEFVRRIKAGP
jgi:hypothetical protein